MSKAVQHFLSGVGSTLNLVSYAKDLKLSCGSLKQDKERIKQAAQKVKSGFASVVKRKETVLSHNNNTATTAEYTSGKEDFADAVLPDPEYLAELERISPGFMAWFMAETSKEAEARRELDKHRLNIIKKGQKFGLAVGVLTILTTCLL